MYGCAWAHGRRRDRRAYGLHVQSPCNTHLSAYSRPAALQLPITAQEHIMTNGNKRGSFAGGAAASTDAVIITMPGAAGAIELRSSGSGGRSSGGRDGSSNGGGNAGDSGGRKKTGSADAGAGRRPRRRRRSSLTELLTWSRVPMPDGQEDLLDMDTGGPRELRGVGWGRRGRHQLASAPVISMQLYQHASLPCVCALLSALPPLGSLAHPACTCRGAAAGAVTQGAARLSVLEAPAGACRRTKRRCCCQRCARRLALQPGGGQRGRRGWARRCKRFRCCCRRHRSWAAE